MERKGERGKRGEKKRARASSNIKLRKAIPI
jgi:hypothetical protein